nr:MAG TPA: hypothetical protein [Caudoviricetes sp.]
MYLLYVTFNMIYLIIYKSTNVKHVLSIIRY